MAARYSEKTYANKGGDSGVASYESSEDSLTVYFTSGAVYLYTVDSCGEFTLDLLKRLARAGRGLNSWLTLTKPPFESKG